MRGARLVLAVSLMVGWASTAAAEGAWVVWIKKEDMLFEKHLQSFTSWELISAQPTREECLGVKAGVWETVADQYSDLSQYPGIEKVDRVPHELLITTRKEGLGGTTKTFYCLPDTIDPREKRE